MQSDWHIIHNIYLFYIYKLQWSIYYIYIYVYIDLGFGLYMACVDAWGRTWIGVDGGAGGRGGAGDGGAGDRRGRARADERAAALDMTNSTKTKMNCSDPGRP